MNRSKIVLLVCLSVLLFSVSSLQAKEFKDKKYSHVTYPDWFVEDEFFELDEDLANARAAGKQGLMLMYSVEGCSYCALFAEQSLGDPEIATMLREHFDSLALDIFSDTNITGPFGQQTTMKTFAKQEGVMFSPTILFYNRKGKRVFRITGYQAPERFKISLQYVIGKHYLTQTMADYVQGRRGKPDMPATISLKQDPLFSRPPFLLQRNVIAAQQPLLVIFESENCEECDVFHNKVLASKQVRDLLQDYEVVRLNSRDQSLAVITPAGKRVTAAAWYKEEGFSRTPALMFFNESGLAAIKTDNLVLEQRMLNSINYVNERAYTKGWSYQRFARSKAIERNLNNTANAN